MTDRILRLSVMVKEHLRRPCARLLLGFSLLLPLTGCSSLNQHLCDGTLLTCRNRHSLSNISDARDAAFWASQHERAGSEKSVDLYFLAATLSYSEATELACMPQTDGTSSETIYHKSLAGLIRTAQQFCRYDPIQGIRVQRANGPLTIPIAYHGFTWGPSDFSRLVIADRSVPTDLKTNYYCSGIGVPLTAIREKETPERFHASSSHFAATAVLKANSEQLPADCEPTWTLEMANPLTVNCTKLNGQSVRIAADYSAPIRYTMGRVKRTYLQDFLRPGVSTGEAKLMLLEPYQPGKIPVIFIHGLLSDPLTWAELYETIHVDRELQDRYQFWAFRYPTGAAFLRSAAVLRRELAAVVECVDPDGSDPALSQTVLIGHSMGGLLAKLQITSSEDILWKSFANKPMDCLQLSPKMRSQLQELLFFESSPHIKRVVFIGTPHNGSVVANRWIGRLGSYLVRVPDSEMSEYQTFLKYNPGVVHKFATKRIPTSVDMLEPDNPILNGMARLPMSPCVTTHSIIGTGGCVLRREPSDDVVPVASAQIPGVESELFVDEVHEKLHHDPGSIAEVLRILRLHLQCNNVNR